MPDQFTDVTTTGYGGRIVNSIKGVVIGLILFVVSFGLLYWNEGRVDLSNIAKTATEISSAIVNTDSTWRSVELGVLHTSSAPRNCSIAAPAISPRCA